MKHSIWAATWAATLFCGAALSAAELLVLNKEDATLVFVDPASGKVTATVAVGEGPHELAVSGDGKLAFASNYGSRTPGRSISVVDVAARKELRRVDLSPLERPHGLWFHGGKLYFSAEANKMIGRYDPASNRVDWMMGTGQNGTHMVMLNRDGSQIYAPNIASNTVTIFDAPNWNATVVPVGKGPEGLDLSPDGKELWTAHSRDGMISVIDTAAKKVTATIDARTRRSNRIKFTPDGRHALVSDLEGGELVVLDVAAKKEVKRLKLGKSPEGILMVPGGEKAYVAVAGDNYIAAIDLKSFQVVGRIQPGNGPDGMAWLE